MPLPTRSVTRLAQETSPYLLQHAHNPVDWYAWGKEALDRAKAEDKPIFLSIGYSACHWCHVMERESFEDPEIAAFLNEHFVPIKVDREERPDLDDLYMGMVQRMTGGGGWPLSVWLTPELKPFYGGTYYPPRSAHGRPGFLEVLQVLDDYWRNRRDEVLASADQIDASAGIALAPASAGPLPRPAELLKLEAAWLRAFQAAFDSVWGGFGGAPKFPRAEELRWLLAFAQRAALSGDAPAAAAGEARDMALHTLRKMAEGGMYDQVGGGFHRYSTDERWMIPHFEKMLYDQGTLIPAYVDAWRTSGEPFFAHIARATSEYLLREMRDPAGGFWSSTDADSEGGEGRFFVWSPGLLEEALGEELGRFAAALYGVNAFGNFEHGTSVLSAAASPEEAAKEVGIEHGDPERLATEVRGALYAARSKRVPPATDDKVLTAWNGLAIDALAQAGMTLDEPRFTAAAAAAAGFLLQNLRTEDGWLRSWRQGKAKNRAVLEDYAYLSRGLLSLFQASGEERWLEEAAATVDEMLQRFGDAETGVFFDSDGRDPSLRHRLKSPWDGATPSPNAVALESLLLLHAFTGEARYRDVAARGYAALLPMIEQSPRAFTTSLRGLALAVEAPSVAVVIGTGSHESLSEWRTALFALETPLLLPVFRASAAPDSEIGLFAQRPAAEGKATLYLCRGAACLAPCNDPAKLPELLSR